MPLIQRRSYFINVLNLSQLTTVKAGTKINPEKAREVLDTNIFELLPTQTTRQDQINDFFNEFNDLVGQAPPIQDVDNDGAGEYIQPSADELDENGRVSYENKSTAYITRLNTHANTNNQGKTLESMRNKLNTYLGDVDNVVQVISDQRPEYENKSNGFLKIRKPNQAIILRNPNQLLEFQKTVTVGNDTGPSFLMEGFTITMWVRFVGKTGRGTLFNFGNPTSQESPYGFRLETLTDVTDSGQYKRMVRLVVRDTLDTTDVTGGTLPNGKLYDNHWGADGLFRIDNNGRGSYGGGYNNTERLAYEFNENGESSGGIGHFVNYPQIPTDDLNEWFFICATYNPHILEDYSLHGEVYDDYKNNKQFWLNHIQLDNVALEFMDIGTGNPNTVSTSDVSPDGSEWAAIVIHPGNVIDGAEGLNSIQVGNTLIARYTFPDDATGGRAGVEYEYSFTVEEIRIDSNTHSHSSQPDEHTHQNWQFLSSELAASLPGSIIFDMFEYGLPTTGDPFTIGAYLTEYDGADSTIVANSNLGAKCKVEVISRSDLLRARGYKVDSLEADVESG